MTESYRVDLEALRSVAGSLTGQANETSALVRQARDAGVPAGAWGPVGADLGLDELYVDVREHATRSLDSIHDFLDWAASNLRATARHYDEHERSTARRFTTLQTPDDPGAAP